MILVDMNQIAIASAMMQLRLSENSELDENMIRHMILNTLRNYRNQYGPNSVYDGTRSSNMYTYYGELVLCYDDKKNWRKDYFPNYKFSRKKSRKESEHDWNEIFNVLNKIKEELIRYFPYKVIQVDSAEADDIIGSVVFHWAPYFQETQERIMIISSDKDFAQLHKYEYVDQHSPIAKMLITFSSGDKYIKEHILKGDRSDGVPNILSGDDVFVEGLRQKPLSKKKISDWLDMNPEDFCDENMLRNYQRNEKLISLKHMPLEIMQSCWKEFNKGTNEISRKKLFDFFVDNKLNELIDDIGDF